MQKILFKSYLKHVEYLKHFLKMISKLTLGKWNILLVILNLRIKVYVVFVEKNQKRHYLLYFHFVLTVLHYYIYSNINKNMTFRQRLSSMSGLWDHTRIDPTSVKLEIKVLDYQNQQYFILYLLLETSSMASKCLAVRSTKGKHC